MSGRVVDNLVSVRKVQRAGVCPYCESRILNHCNNRECKWGRCKNTYDCGAFGTVERFIRVTKAPGL